MNDNQFGFVTDKLTTNIESEIMVRKLSEEICSWGVLRYFWSVRQCFLAGNIVSIKMSRCREQSVRDHEVLPNKSGNSAHGTERKSKGSAHQKVHYLTKFIPELYQILINSLLSSDDESTGVIIGYVNDALLIVPGRTRKKIMIRGVSNSYT